MVFKLSSPAKGLELILCTSTFEILDKISNLISIR